MTFNRIESSLSDTDIRFLTGVSNGKIQTSSLIAKLLEIISDDSPYKGLISEDKSLSLFRMLRAYFDSCFTAYLRFCIGEVKLDKLFEHKSALTYHTLASNGLRVSTVNEIQNGIEELSVQSDAVLTPEVEQNIALLLWTFTGSLRYYKQAGLTFNYENGSLVETEYQLIVRAGNKLRQLVDWMVIPSNYDEAIKKLEDAKKHNLKYEYPSFALDEVENEKSVKQIVYLCCKDLDSKCFTENQLKARGICAKINSRKYKPNPYEISIMRKAYTEYTNGIKGGSFHELHADVQSLVNAVDIAVEKGLLAKWHIAVKVAESVRRWGKCSVKQQDTMERALRKLDKSILNPAKNKETKDKYIDNEMLSMSDALGAGLFDGQA